MANIPFSKELVLGKIKESRIKEVGKAKIRELVYLTKLIEAETGVPFFHMEMGVPGLNSPNVGIEAAIEALRHGVSSKYAMIDGLPELKQEMSRFLTLFVDIEVSPKGIIPTVGSMQASCISFMVCSKLFKERQTTLFIDPGFPVHKQQHQILSIPFKSFDVYNFRGEKLESQLRKIFDTGEISSVLYSNPNNPTWVCLTEQELEIIGTLCKEYKVIPIEDLAYFGMDYRKDYSVPGKAPFQPSVSKFCDDYVMLFSSSKLFSYAGERVATMIISNNLFDQYFENLETCYSIGTFGNAAIFGCLYALSAGAGHSSQYALKAMLKAVNDGGLSFVEATREYEVRAKKIKRIFLDNGFYIVYDKDGEQNIGDGFYFTIAYPGMTSFELIERLLFYGISAISLANTGSEKIEGIRACVSQIRLDTLDELERRVKLFHQKYK